MTCAQYLTAGPHHPERAQIDGLPICSEVSQPGVYSSPDLDPYSAVSGVSSFNYPAAADPSLLTPASSAGSPPLQHRQSSAKPGQGFSQAPTPPDSTKMYGFNTYDVGSSSQAESPMTVHPSVTEAASFDMSSYMAHSPPVSHHPSSPKADNLPPIDPYLGHFTVSAANDGEVTHHSLQEYQPYNVSMAGPGTYLAPHPVTVGTPQMHHRMPSNGPPPVLSQPHPSHFRPHPTPQVGAIEDLRDPSLLLGPYSAHGALSPGRRAPPRKKPSPSRRPSRAPKATHHLGHDANNQFKQEDDGEELTLSEDAPEDDRYLFQLRKEFISEKGKGMWEEMKAKYSEKHQGNWEKAALQMKVSRAVGRFGVWPQQEIERLKEAFAHVEEMRYNLIIARMKENGGCRVWDWKRGHIETMLVRLGLEDMVPNEKTGSRRRKQKAARRHGSPQTGPPPTVMGDWSNGLGLHHPAFHGHGHAHHVAAGAAARQGQPFDNVMADGFPTPPNMTPAQQDELIDQVFNIKTERSLSPDDGMDGLSFDDNDAASRRPSTVASHELNHQ